MKRLGAPKRRELMLVMQFVVGCQPRVDVAFWDEGKAASTMPVDSGGMADDLGLCAEGQRTCVELVPAEAVRDACGTMLELTGVTRLVAPDRWSIEDCGGCVTCDGPSYELHIKAPRGWTPETLPTCSTVILEFAATDVPWSCAWQTVAIWSEEGRDDTTAPTFVAASIRTDPPATVDGLDVRAERTEAKDCAAEDCCPIEPGKYELAFSGDALLAPVTVREHEDVPELIFMGQAFTLRNERSHVHEACDATPHFDWILKTPKE